MVEPEIQSEQPDPVAAAAPLLDPDREEELFRRIREGDPAAQDALFALVYGELHRFAGRRLGAQCRRHTLGATGVVNEVLLKLMKGPQDFVDRTHFMAVAARCMRQVLCDYARRKESSKRKAPGQRVELDEVLESYEQRFIDVLALDEALRDLEAAAPLLGRLVELRFFAGQTVEECARILGISRTQTVRKLRTARARLYRVLHGADLDS